MSAYKNISKVELYNHSGKKVLNKKGIDSKQIQIKVGDFPSGLYVLKLKIDKSFVVRKIEVLNN